MLLSQMAQNQFYEMFCDAGPVAALIVPCAVLTVVTTAGILMNAFVVYVSATTKSLHGTANYLLALISLFELLHQTGQFVFFGVVVSGTNFITKRTASLLLMPMMFGMIGSMAGITCAAVDRFIAIIAGSVHSRMNKHAYLAALSAICACFGAFGVHIIYLSGEQEPTEPTTGYLAEMLSGDVGKQLYADVILLNAVSSLCYGSIWIVTYVKKQTTQHTNGRLLKSLITIMGANVGGYFLNICVLQVVMAFGDQLGALGEWYWTFLPTILLNLCATSNAPILYVISTDYRKAFKQKLNFWQPKHTNGETRVIVLRTKLPPKTASIPAK